jgi:hypothetical protein
VFGLIEALLFSPTPIAKPCRFSSQASQVAAHAAAAAFNERLPAPTFSATLNRSRPATFAATPSRGAPAMSLRTTAASAGRSRASAVVLLVVARLDAPSYGRRLRRLDLSYWSNRFRARFCSIRYPLRYPKPPRESAKSWAMKPQLDIIRSY